MEENPFRRLYTHLPEDLWLHEGEYYDLLELPYLIPQPANIIEGHIRLLYNLHSLNHWVYNVGEHPNNRGAPVIERHPHAGPKAPSINLLGDLHYKVWPSSALDDHRSIIQDLEHSRLNMRGAHQLLNLPSIPVEILL
ncbi:hypothetical protein D1872_271520 [compost metagenome]